MLLQVIYNNRVIILENVFTWVMYSAAAAAALMPLFQILALGLGIMVSILTGIKLIKDLTNKKNENNNKKK